LVSLCGDLLRFHNGGSYAYAHSLHEAIEHLREPREAMRRVRSRFKLVYTGRQYYTVLLIHFLARSSKDRLPFAEPKVNLEISQHIVARTGNWELFVRVSATELRNVELARRLPNYGRYEARGGVMEHSGKPRRKRISQ